MSSPIRYLVLVLLVSACIVVGTPEPNPATDMSRAGDLTASPLCSPKNCAGCCLGEVCQPGIKAAACGGGGAVCAQCSDAQLCGADLLCAFDPNAIWLVAAVQASIMTTKPTGMPWRTDASLPQPLVEYDAKNRTNARAIVISGTPPVWTVTWGEGFTYSAKDLLSTGFDLQVLDQINGMTTQPISNKHHVTLSQQDFVTKNLTYQGWEGVKTLTLTLQRQ